MNKIYIGLISVLLYGCEQNNAITLYDTDDAYVHFAYPNPDNSSVERYTDSIFVNFSLLSQLYVDETVIKIPVNITGTPSGQDREYTVVISPDSEYDPNLITLSDAIIHANKYVDTLEVTIKNDEMLSSSIMELRLELMDNQNFEAGNLFNQTFKISFSNQLLKPIWWDTWQRYFGIYYKEVYQAWIQLYQEGLDPNGYYWNNMPPADPVFYPVTFMYLEQLKTFFKENVVYPENDPTRLPISLP